MELLGLVLAFPAVLMANVLYALIVKYGLSTRRALWPWLIWPSRAVLALLVLDLGSVAVVGPVVSRQVLGPPYCWMHELVVILGAPALANLMLIPGGERWYHRWYVVAGVCYIVGMFLVFLQVTVGDALFGPDGVGGPFAT
jgi:hypothetical protein